MLSQHSPEVFSKLNIKTYLSEWTYYSTANFTAKLTFVRGSLFSMFINKIMKSYPPLSIIIASRGNHFNEGGIYYFSMNFHNMCERTCTLSKNKTILYLLLSNFFLQASLFSYKKTL